ncbi:hypothetical protein WH5701_09595 [Synechococcus sp. WH 5701]|nr:hypothetical protein WH5701_09595 [Synechococcus sp. WH 5701]
MHRDKSGSWRDVNSISGFDCDCILDLKAAWSDQKTLAEIAIDVNEICGDSIRLDFIRLSYNPLSRATARSQHHDQRRRSGCLKEKLAACIKTHILAVELASVLRS